jgi:hypothetical protein
MSMRDILSRLDQLNESSTMKSAVKKPTGPKFPGYWKGTDPASQAKNKMVGGSAEESIIHDLERALVENPRTDAHRLMAEWRAYKEDEIGAYQPEPGAANQGDLHTPSPIGSGTNEARIHTPKTVDVYYRPNTTSDKARIIARSIPYTTLELLIRAMTKKFGTRPEDFEWTSVDEPYGHRLGEEQLAEYGGVGPTGTASQAPLGTTAQNPDPEQAKQQADATQIQKNTNQIAPTLNAQGAAQPVNKVKFQDVMNKLDVKSNQDLPGSDLKQLQPLAVAASKALQDPQTANQLKQVINKADQLSQKKDDKAKQAAQQVGTNPTAADQQANSQQNNTQQQPQAGATK